MKIWGELKPLRFDEKEMGRVLGSDNFIFVGSSTDMWAKDVPDIWIQKVLRHCFDYRRNEYLFQSKNPQRFITMQGSIGVNCTLGTTIETNRDYKISNAPKIIDRTKSIRECKTQVICHTMVTIEPIIDFDLYEFVDLIKLAAPHWVNIGADSKNHGLPEPSYQKVIELIEALKKFTEVRKKSNLERLKKVY